MNNEQKLKLAKARSIKAPNSIQVFANPELEDLYLKLNGLYENITKLIDSVNIKPHMSEQGKALINLNNTLVKLMGKFERGLDITNLEEIKPATDLFIKNLDEIIIPKTQFPTDLAKDDSIKKMHEQLIALMVKFNQFVSTPTKAVKPGQLVTDFVPMRRVRLQGSQLVFDDKSWAGASGSGGGAATGSSAYSKDTSIYRNLSLDATGYNIKASGGAITGYYIVNRHATLERFIKIYNTAGVPTVGTDTPVITIPLQPLTAANMPTPDHIAFSVGIGIGATTAIADNSSSAPSANDVVVNIYYV